MERGPAAHRRATRPIRVGSPSAAKTRTEFRMASALVAAPSDFLLRSLSDISLNVAHLDRPALRVTSIGSLPPLDGDLVKARLRDLQKSSARGFFQLENHQGGGLLRIIFVGIDGMWLPTPGEQPFRLHLLHGH